MLAGLSSGMNVTGSWTGSVILCQMLKLIQVALCACQERPLRSISP